MNRKQHMDWCKERALEYLDKKSEYYSVQNAFASMLSDIGKHDETIKLKDNPLISALIMDTMMNMSHNKVKSFIEGLN